MKNTGVDGHQIRLELLKFCDNIPYQIDQAIMELDAVAASPSSPGLDSSFFEISIRY